MANDEVVILCYRTCNQDVLIVDGASQTKCQTCGQDVWIAPSSVEVRKQMNATVVCEVCGKKVLKAQIGSIDFMPITREQVEEISDTIANRKRRN